MSAGSGVGTCGPAACPDSSISLLRIDEFAKGEATVKELAEPFAVSLPAISRHLKVLERAGLITRRRAAQSRPTSLRIEGLTEADEWMDTCRAVWEGRVHRLDAHLNEMLKGEANE